MLHKRPRFRGIRRSNIFVSRSGVVRGNRLLGLPQAHTPSATDTLRDDGHCHVPVEGGRTGRAHKWQSGRACCPARATAISLRTRFPFQSKSEGRRALGSCLDMWQRGRPPSHRSRTPGNAAGRERLRVAESVSRGASGNTPAGARHLCTGQRSGKKKWRHKAPGLSKAAQRIRQRTWDDHAAVLLSRGLSRPAEGGSTCTAADVEMRFPESGQRPGSGKRHMQSQAKRGEGRDGLWLSASLWYTRPLCGLVALSWPCVVAGPLKMHVRNT